MSSAQPVLSDTLAGSERSINVCASASLTLGPDERSLAQPTARLTNTSTASSIPRRTGRTALIKGSDLIVYWGTGCAFMYALERGCQEWQAAPFPPANITLN